MIHSIKILNESMYRINANTDFKTLYLQLYVNGSELTLLSTHRLNGMLSNDTIR